MQVKDKNQSSVNSATLTSKNIISAGLAFTISAFTTFKPMDNEQIIPDTKQSNQFNELKIESDAYDLIRESLK